MVSKSVGRSIKVAQVIDEYTVVINIGSQEAVTVGDDFILYRMGEEIFDPDTKESLGFFEEVIGRGAVTHVQERISTLKATEIVEGGRKIIRRNSGIISLVQGLKDTEEIIEHPDKVKPFRHAQIGDYAKPV